MYRTYPTIANAVVVLDSSTAVVDAPAEAHNASSQVEKRKNDEQSDQGETSVYDGAYFRNKRNGFGILKDSDGYIYKGQWMMDKKHGAGFETKPNGSVFDCNFVKGRKQGDGRFMYKNGDYFTGTWSQGKIEGVIHYTSANGDTLVGEYRNRAPVGHVTVSLTPGGVRYTFPWPESAVGSKSRVDECVHAARDQALVLHGMAGSVCLEMS